MPGKLYQWTLALAESPRATWALGALAFAESSFFPLPPDLILIPMSLAQPKRALSYATICTIASVAGGVLGYAIGALLYGTVGKWLISVYGYGDRIAQLQVFYQHWGWAFILVKGLTPIPFKLVTIVSGLLGYNLPLFIVLSAITRGARFFLLAGLLTRFGDPIRAKLERYYPLFLLMIVAIIVGGFVIAAGLV
jgi:membrane protein YqaA with SNARE-associated domain